MNIPKVPGLPVIGHSVPFQNNALNFTSKMQKKYGDIFEISLLNEKFVVILDPISTKEIFLDKDNNFSSKEGWSFTLGPTFENGLMLRDFDDHKYHRSLLQDSFRHDAIHNYLHIIQPTIDKWIKTLSESKNFNLYDSVKQLMFDISLRLFFLDVKPDESKFLNKLFTDSISSATSLLRWPLPFTKLKKGIEAREYLLDYFQEKAKLVNEDTDKTLFAELVRTNKGDAGLSDFEIAEHMIFLLLAAHDTTTITLTNSLYYLSQDEDYRNNVLNESLSVDHTDISSLKNGNFAEAMFKEAMRIYPPVPFSIRYVVDDIVVNGATLKGGTYTTISPLLLHHDERYWSNPSIFDPLRFIDPSYHNDAYFPFAGGAHTCLGKFFASYMYKNVVYKFVQSFNDYTINEKLEIRPTPIPHPLEDVRVSI